VRYQIGKQEPPLTSRERFLHALAADPRDEAPAQLNSCRGTEHQGFTKIAVILICHNGASFNQRRKTMKKLINCECGEVVRGNSDEELVAAVQAHISRDHPELVGKLSQQDILSMSEEE
jgi:predicted small metal-binding protein